MFANFHENSIHYIQHYAFEECHKSNEVSIVIGIFYYTPVYIRIIIILVVILSIRVLID